MMRAFTPFSLHRSGRERLQWLRSVCFTVLARRGSLSYVSTITHYLLGCQLFVYFLFVVLLQRVELWFLACDASVLAVERQEQTPEHNLSVPHFHCYVSVLMGFVRLTSVFRFEVRTGLEPVTHLRETGLQSAAFNLSATAPFAGFYR